MLNTNVGNFTTYREIYQNGRDWIVINGVAIVEGVLNDRYVPKEEFAAFPEDWNGMPIVLRHPDKNKFGGSARVPNPTSPVLGSFYNSRLDDDRLVGEFWVDKEELLSYPEGKMIYANIKAGRPTEVSTAYYSDMEKKPGEYKGKKYNFEDSNIHPDHIAILPDEVGACSIADGCGLSRNSAMKTNCAECKCNKIAQNAQEVYSPVGPVALRDAIKAAFDKYENKPDAQFKFEGYVEHGDQNGQLLSDTIFYKQINEADVIISFRAIKGRDAYRVYSAVCDILSGYSWSISNLKAEILKIDENVVGLQFNFQNGDVYQVEFKAGGKIDIGNDKSDRLFITSDGDVRMMAEAFVEFAVVSQL